VPTLISGNAKIYVSFTEEKENAFDARAKAKPISITGDLIHTEQNYYVFVESITDNVEMTLTIH
jgi:hypothetical protein